MTRDAVINDYFDWMSNLVCVGAHFKRTSYRKLLMRLHDTEFRYSITNDGNRAEDGTDLRHRFASEFGIKNISLYLTGPCSVLEMMIALSIRCEEHIMDDPDIGDRTSKWFWGMVANLRLETMSDTRFNINYVDEKISIFLDREYASNGNGGLFTVSDCEYDLRYVEIWYQMCWYLNDIL